MKSVEHIFSDNGGNHLLVALYFCDDDYKRDVLHIPIEYEYIKIVDINITKAYVDRPIHFSVFFKMVSWLLQEYKKDEETIYTFICSTDDLETNHPNFLPQEFRWKLFDRLYRREIKNLKMNIQDVVVGPEGYQSMARAFYRDKHAPIIHVISAYLRDKQLLYQ